MFRYLPILLPTIFVILSVTSAFCCVHFLLLTLFVTYTFCFLNILAFMYLFQILSLSDVLNITQTAFTILSGQGEALNIDPQHFYTHLYRVLPQLNSGNIPLISYKLSFTSIHVYLLLFAPGFVAGFYSTL